MAICFEFSLVNLNDGMSCPPRLVTKSASVSILPHSAYTQPSSLSAETKSVAPCSSVTRVEIS